MDINDVSSEKDYEKHIKDLVNLEESNLEEYIFEKKYEKYMKELDDWIGETKSMMSKYMIILNNIKTNYEIWNKNKNKNKF